MDEVRLIDVDDATLAALVDAATGDADPDDVTPPLTAGSEWTATRIEWLEDYHRRCRAGLAGPVGEQTWALTVAEHGDVLGSVRLRTTSEPGVLETGIWLTKSARGSGIGGAAIRATLEFAASIGAVAVVADTTPQNVAALRILQRSGFEIVTRSAERVRARCRLVSSSP